MPVMGSRSLALALLPPALLAPATAHATPEDELRDAENSYLYGDYPRVIAKLTPIVEPDILLADPEDLVRAYELLGLASFFLDRTDAARTWFERLIRFRPDARLNPVLVPPPAVAFFDDIRAALADEIAAMREALRRQQAEEEERRRRALLTQVRVETRVNSRLVASLPFGAGQFQNGDTALGYTLLATQAATSITSLACFLAIEDLRLPTNRFDRADIDRVETLRDVQVWTGAIALVLMAGGIVHAWATFVDEAPLREIALPPPAAPAEGSLFHWRF